MALVLGVLLIFGLVLVSCDSGGGGTAPKITVTTVEMVLNANGYWNIADPKSTFAINERVGYKFSITDLDKDVKGYGYIIKKGGEVYFPGYETDYRRINNGSTSDTFTYRDADTIYEAGTYTIEAYVFDLKGNKSKTVTVSFTVQ